MRFAGGCGKNTTGGWAASDAEREGFAEFPVALEIPLAAHGLPPRAEFLRVQQGPDAAARALGSGAGVVHGHAPRHVGGPSDVGQGAIRRTAAEDVNEAWHAAIMRDSWRCRQCRASR